MPTKTDQDNYERLMKTGVCSCGEHFEKHANNIDELKTNDIRCKLLKSEVQRWHTPAGIQP